MNHLEWEMSQEGHSASLWINNLIYIRIVPFVQPGGITYAYDVNNASMRTILSHGGYTTMDAAKTDGLRAAWDCLVTTLGDLSGLGGGA